MQPAMQPADDDGTAAVALQPALQPPALSCPFCQHQQLQPCHYRNQCPSPLFTGPHFSKGFARVPAEEWLFKLRCSCWLMLSRSSRPYQQRRRTAKDWSAIDSIPDGDLCWVTFSGIQTRKPRAVDGNLFWGPFRGAWAQAQDEIIEAYLEAKSTLERERMLKWRRCIEGLLLRRKGKSKGKKRPASDTMERRFQAWERDDLSKIISLWGTWHRARRSARDNGRFLTPMQNQRTWRHGLCRPTGVLNATAYLLAVVALLGCLTQWWWWLQLFSVLVVAADKSAALALAGCGSGGGFSSAGCRLFVGHTKHSSPQDLVRMFSASAGVQTIDVKRNNLTNELRGFAFVDFATHAAASRAQQEFDGALFPADSSTSTLTVRFAQPRASLYGGRWRAPEQAMRVLCLAGGGTGLLAGCLIFRHKTRKLYFAVSCFSYTLLHLLIVSTSTSLSLIISLVMVVDIVGSELHVWRPHHHLNYRW